LVLHHGNHKNIFADSGVEWKEYKYYNPATIGLDLEGMLADINAAPSGSVFILHGGGRGGWDSTVRGSETRVQVLIRRDAAGF
jgi:hypothetical protein